MLTFSISCENEEDEEHLSAPDVKAFSFSDIERATNGFSTENKIGEGGFGVVYKVKSQNPFGLISCLGGRIFVLCKHETCTIRIIIHFHIYFTVSTLHI